MSTETMHDQQHSDQQQPDEAQQPHTTDDDALGGEVRERQKLRARAREAEEQRDALAARVAAHQRSEVLRLAADHLAEPTDLLDLSGVQVSDLLDTDGNVDEEKVASTATALVQQRGQRFARPPRAGNYDGGVRTTIKRESTSWSSVLRDQR